MPRWLKFVLLFLGIGIVGFGLLIGGFVWWISANKDRLAETGQRATSEGHEYGASHTQAECVSDGLSHLKACGMVDFVCEAENKIRLTSCLPVAKVDDTCNDVPGPTDIWKLANWSNQQCDERGYRGSQPCGRLMQGVAEVCAKPRRSPNR
jgi:hypothetical protein